MSDLILKNRSYRRFDESERIPAETLRSLVDLARLGASSSNVQPLKFLLSNDPEKNAKIFETLAWAGYLKDWSGPVEGERPSAYIVILGDKDISTRFRVNHGIAAQSILLGATEKGLGGCMVGSIQRDKLREHLKLADRFEVLLVVALGRPVEQVIIEETGSDGDIKYYRDANNVHHVPKRPLEEIILE